MYTTPEDYFYIKPPEGSVAGRPLPVRLDELGVNRLRTLHYEDLAFLYEFLCEQDALFSWAAAGFPPASVFDGTRPTSFNPDPAPDIAQGTPGEPLVTRPLALSLVPDGSGHSLKWGLSRVVGSMYGRDPKPSGFPVALFSWEDTELNVEIIDSPGYVFGMVEMSTDGTAPVAWHYRYDSYGSVTVDPGSRTSFPDASTATGRMLSALGADLASGGEEGKGPWAWPWPATRAGTVRLRYEALDALYRDAMALDSVCVILPTSVFAPDAEHDGSRWNAPGYRVSTYAYLGLNLDDPRPVMYRGEFVVKYLRKELEPGVYESDTEKTLTPITGSPEFPERDIVDKTEPDPSATAGMTWRRSISLTAGVYVWAYPVSHESFKASDQAHVESTSCEVGLKSEITDVNVSGFAERPRAFDFSSPPETLTFSVDANGLIPPGATIRDIRAYASIDASAKAKVGISSNDSRYVGSWTPPEWVTLDLPVDSGVVDETGRGEYFHRTLSCVDNKNGHAPDSLLSSSFGELDVDCTLADGVLSLSLSGSLWSEACSWYSAHDSMPDSVFDGGETAAEFALDLIGDIKDLDEVIPITVPYGASLTDLFVNSVPHGAGGPWGVSALRAAWDPYAMVAEEGTTEERNETGGLTFTSTRSFGDPYAYTRSGVSLDLEHSLSLSSVILFIRFGFASSDEVPSMPDEEPWESLDSGSST